MTFLERSRAYQLLTFKRWDTMIQHKKGVILVIRTFPQLCILGVSVVNFTESLVTAKPHWGLVVK